MDFAWPWAFLLAVPWGFAAWRAVRAARTRGAVFAGASARLGGGRPSWRVRAARALPFVFLAGAAALIVAAAGPRRTLAREVRAADALAVMMAVDVSGSMAALDLSEPGGPDRTRLEVVKATFRDFVARRPDDLIGLVTFGGYASCRAPLTADHRALLHTLAGVEIPQAEDEQLTAIGDGLSVALLRLREAEPKTKIAILLSDGENNVGAVTPQEAAQAAKTLGVRVYAIGVGSTGVAPFWGVDRFTGRRVKAQGQVSLDEATLRAIAQETGGRYANVRSREDLEAFLREVAELETTRVERQVYTRHLPRSRPWLAAGGALCLAAALGLAALLRRPI